MKGVTEFMSKDDLFYVCTMIEYVARETHNKTSDEISNFNSNVYYSNPDYIKCSYEAGELLA